MRRGGGAPQAAAGPGAWLRAGSDRGPAVRPPRCSSPAEVWPTALDRYRWDGARLYRGGRYCLPKDVGPLAAGDGPRPRYGVTGFPYEAAVWSSGAEVLSDDKRQWVLDRPAAAEAVQRCADLSAVHRVAPMAPYGSGPGAGQLFEAQAAATHIDGRWMVPRFRSLPFDWDVAPVPAARAGAPSNASAVLAGGLARAGVSSRPGRAPVQAQFASGSTRRRTAAATATSRATPRSDPPRRRAARRSGEQPIRRLAKLRPSCEQSIRCFTKLRPFGRQRFRRPTELRPFGRQRFRCPTKL